MQTRVGPKYAFVAFLIWCIGAALFVWAVLEVKDWMQEPEEVVEQTDDRIWCYMRTIQPGDSFGEVEPGNYEYAAIATMSGIDLYKRCQQ